MRWFALSPLAVLTLLAVSAHAQTIDLSWQACSPIVVDWTAQSATTVSVVASVTGQSQSHQAYEVWWVVGDAESRLPDAWRFDTAGCAAGFCEIASQPTAALLRSCPPLVPATTQQFVIPAFQFAPPSLGYPSSMGNGCLTVAYPAGSSAANPAYRYHAARFTFDFTYGATGPGNGSTSCGGLERPLTLRLVPGRAGWLDQNQMQHEWGLGNATLTVNGGTDPNAASTWGQIKGQYRQ